MTELERYLRIFTWHGLEESDFYLSDDVGGAVRTAFEQLSELAKFHTPFNESLPRELVEPLRSFRRGESPGRRLAEDPERCAFFLSDLLDYLRLLQRRSG